AEDGIRDFHVTGVQTCALPICDCVQTGRPWRVEHNKRQAGEQRNWNMTQQDNKVRPLDGITVVSLEHAIAAPFCTRQLADLGARVIKVERPGSGDFARGYDERVDGLASHFVWTNRSKESLTLDLKQDDAMQVLDKLLSQADVLVQNLAPGAAARM